ncbi:MAG: primosomal protein N' [Spirochaetes bacterium]|nr:primosomal protein N' [Spirochaetota bacterium]
MKNNKYTDVYVGYPVEGSYTYLIPEDLDVQTGTRVRVNFKNRVITAFAHRVHNNKPDFNYIKDVQKVIDQAPIFDSRLIDLAEYTASSYLCNTGEVLATALPSGETASDRYKHPFKNKKKVIRNIKLNKEQSIVYDNILNSFNDNKFSHLIFGITGSGKTEIYIEIAKYIISLGRSVIYLVPEITLSSQIFERLYNVFHDELIVYHSQLTANQRLKSWLKFYSGEAKIAVGTRSAVFLQCPDLGLIIIDEEHDWSYKEHSTPRYHAKRLAYYRCMKEKSLLIMGSATPSLESLYFAETGNMELHNLKSRFGDTLLPEIDIVTINPKKSESLISNKLLINSKKAISQNNQAIFLLNRRGFSPVVLCSDCGKVFECPYCNISLNLHKSGHAEKMICHYCGYQRNVPEHCPECGSENILTLGAGTQKVEDSINETFKDAKIVRLDQDTTRKKSAIFEIVDKMAAGEIDILLGTQMVAKGFDFHNVSIVGVLLADIGLNMPDFRASERIFSLLIQVAGRCGRRNERGKVIIQTLERENYIYDYLKNHDYLGFYRHELTVRKTLNYPPFSRMARLLIRGKIEEKVINEINKVYKSLENEINKNNYSISLLGPVAAPFAKISSNYRYHIILKAEKIEQIRNVIKSIDRTAGKDLYLEIDIDPYDIL